MEIAISSTANELVVALASKTKKLIVLSDPSSETRVIINKNPDPDREFITFETQGELLAVIAARSMHLPQEGECLKLQFLPNCLHPKISVAPSADYSLDLFRTSLNKFYEECPELKTFLSRYISPLHLPPALDWENNLQSILLGETNT